MRPISAARRLPVAAASRFHGSFTTTGTFKSINNVALSGKPFSGSWNCHGAFAKH
jgi:hypothetical protein